MNWHSPVGREGLGRGHAEGDCEDHAAPNIRRRKPTSWREQDALQRDSVGTLNGEIGETSWMSRDLRIEGEEIDGWQNVTSVFGRQSIHLSRP
jgi:hypothetical protein